MPTDEVTASRKIGTVCKEHPELGGVRYIRNGTCVGCQAKWSKRRAKHTEVADARNERRRVMRIEDREALLYERHILNATRVVAIELAIAARRSPSLWRDYWVKAVDVINKRISTPINSMLHARDGWKDVDSQPLRMDVEITPPSQADREAVFHVKRYDLLDPDLSPEQAYAAIFGTGDPSTP